MQTALFCVVPDGFRDEEYSIPRDIFLQAGIAVVTASTVRGSLRGKKDLTTAHVDLLVSEARAADYDVIIVVGGQRTFWHDQVLIDLLKDFSVQNKIIGAICSSAVLPLQAGLLHGRAMTAFPGDQELAEMRKHPVTYTADLVTVAGNIVTGSGPEAASAFAQELVRLLNN